MMRKLILIVGILLLVLSACAAPEPVQEASAPAEKTVEPTPDLETGTEPASSPTATTEAILEPTEEPTPYPEPELSADEPTPYPEPEQPSQALIVDPYPAPEAVEWPLVIQDDLENEIELNEYPQSIISLSPSTTEILFAIGAGNQVIGRDDFSLYPEEALAVESIGSLWDGVPTEAILALEPDLVIAAQIVSEEDIQVLIDLGLPVYWQANPVDFDGLYENLLRIAAATGHTRETEVLVASLQARVGGVEEIVANAKAVPSVFYELDATDPSNPWTTGSGTFIDYIITMAGGTNAAAALQGDYAQISAEELIAVNPEIIMLADAMYGVAPESVADRPGWDVIIAVENGAIYPIDPNMMSVPGPRLVDALEETARLIHPELFE